MTNLREYHKDGNDKKDSNVKKGDVGLVFDENLKRRFWKLGRIESLLVHRDQVARGARVRVMKKGNPVILNRPVQKLYPLELSENDKTKVEGKYSKDEVKNVKEKRDESERKTKKNEENCEKRSSKRISCDMGRKFLTNDRTIVF